MQPDQFSDEKRRSVSRRAEDKGGAWIDPSAPVPLHRQVYDRLREDILSGQLAPGARLPPSRVLAEQAGISRSTVTTAYDQLRAEGYVTGRAGGGTTVAQLLPERLLSVASTPEPGARTQESSEGVGLSRRGRHILQIHNVPPEQVAAEAGWRRPFRVGLPALDAFPHDVWSRLLARRGRRSLSHYMDFQPFEGLPPLRQAIASYLSLSRGVRCTADEVIITAGAQGALDLVARVLTDPGDVAWVEDPVYLGASGALQAGGVELAAMPVDEDGLDVAAAVHTAPRARLAFVTPSYQFPLGVTMSLARRLELLAWARRRDAWVIEDDYDSEFRYSARPIAALQGLEPSGRVIYIGTFGKVLFPALRLGYLVVPHGLVDPFIAARRLVDVHPPALEQAVLCDFIEQGHFDRHIRRMRSLYAQRAEALTEAVNARLAPTVSIGMPDGGMHAVAWLPPHLDDTQVARAAAAEHIEARPLSLYRIQRQMPPALVLGFSTVNERQIGQGVERLAEALTPMLS